MKKTRIIATLGPSCDNEDTFKRMMDAGVNCARINTAHGDFESYDNLISMVRRNSDMPVMIDIKGPEVRVRLNENLPFSKDEEVTFDFEEGERSFSYNFYDEVEEQDLVFLDNGTIKSSITKKEGGKITLKFFSGGVLKPNKGVNIPGRPLKIPSLSDKDIKAIKYSIKHDIEYIALSFVRNKEDVINLKNVIGENSAESKDPEIGIIAKIEDQQGVDNIDEIIEESDGVMVARGDLGVEIPEEKIPFIQKVIIRKCNRAGKISIVATQMLESMIFNVVPTRAEISDVANAVLDGTDSVMLSGETAAGKYPVEAVAAMAKVCNELEDKVKSKVLVNQQGTVSEELSKAVYFLIMRSETSKVITITRSGYSARLMTRFRLKEDIIAVTNNDKTYRKLKLVWGVKPVLMEKLPEIAITTAITIELENRKFIQRKDQVVFFAGVKTLQENVSNLIEVHNVEDLMHYHENISHENGKDILKD